ncbi:hypothetical protein [Streptococcus orisasini]|uniref:hypothetical protein n=1 Tax=Streptococcus orisasini TaxID=1080071 RepID=UPI00070E0DC2|nr:hypothetical protein [Streptococcus orisasini]
MNINFSDLITTIIGALIGGLFSYLIVRVQLKYRERDKEDEQASNVATWLTDISDRQSSNDNYIKYDLVINNNSNLPIYNVLIISLSNKVNLHFQDIKFWDYELINYYPILTPGIKKDLINTKGSGIGVERPAVSILFTDVYGKYRYRNQLGQLTQLSTKEYDGLIVRLGYRPPL